VLGRVKDSSSHDSILFAFFAGEREDSKDSRAKARRESFQEKGQIGAQVFKTEKKLAKWKEKLLEKAFF
jgi:hypothetical protein